MTRISRIGSTAKAGTVEEQRRIAHAFVAWLGGLCVEEDRTLTVRVPVDPNAQARRRPKITRM